LTTTRSLIGFNVSILLPIVFSYDKKAFQKYLSKWGAKLVDPVAFGRADRAGEAGLTATLAAAWF